MIAADIQRGVLAHITERGNAVLSDLCGVFPDASDSQLQRALVALVKRGDIVRVGARRGTVYALTLEAAEAARVERFAAAARRARVAAKRAAKDEGKPLVEVLGEASPQA